MRRKLSLSLIVALCSSCVGGQSKEAKTTAAATSEPTRDVPAAARAESDWKAAATGHGAAGAIPKELLYRMEKESSPGGSPEADGGVRAR